LLKPPSYREPDKLISVYETCLPSGFGSVSAPTSRIGASISHAFGQSNLWQMAVLTSKEKAT
jgi:hypothetical protein